MEIIEFMEQKEKDLKLWTEPKEPVGHPQADHGSLRRDTDNVWRNNAWKIPKFDENMNINIQEAQQTPSEIKIPSKILWLYDSTYMRYLEQSKSFREKGEWEVIFWWV